MIGQFQLQYRFLSNFWPASIYFDEMYYTSVEAAYQASKTSDLESRKEICNAKPGRAKRLGRVVPLREDWEEVKLDIMYQLVLQKFNKPGELQEKLLATGDQKLVEGNWWGDDFWGVNLRTGMGENHLGKILMKVRSDIQECMKILQD